MPLNQIFGELLMPAFFDTRSIVVAFRHSPEPASCNGVRSPRLSITNQHRSSISSSEIEAPQSSD